MNIEEAAAIVHPVKAKPDHRAKLQKAIDAFTHDAEYRMEALDDVQALETLGEEIAQAILKANLGNRSNCHGLEIIGCTGYARSPNMADAVDFFCDGLSNGADIVRYAALSMLDQKAG